MILAAHALRTSLAVHVAYGAIHTMGIQQLLQHWVQEVSQQRWLQAIPESSPCSECTGTLPTVVRGRPTQSDRAWLQRRASGRPRLQLI
eukprot:scaffold1970_cov396-Prasinococcus_capsulatus_cf.AAC.30